MLIKYLLPIVSCFFLFFSCGQKSEDNKQVNNNEETTQQWLTFEGKDKSAKHIVLISGDEEYRSEEALPQLAKILSKHHGFKCTVLFAQDPEKPGIVNANYVKNIPGLEMLVSADLMILFTRFRALPDVQMSSIDNYLKEGRPVLGIRTATHAFNFSKDSTSNFSHYGNYYEGDKKEWIGGFGRLVLGEKWINHHGEHKHQSTRGIFADRAETHPLADGIDNGDIWGSTDVYGVRLPLPGDSEPIILGQVINRAGEYNESDIFFGMKSTDSEVATTNKDGLKLNDPMMPIAWTKSYTLPNGKTGRAFTSTIGSSTDLLNDGVRRLLVNGTYWAMNVPVPENADISLVGDYKPTAYSFKDDAYWENRQMKISGLK